MAEEKKKYSPTTAAKKSGFAAGGTAGAAAAIFAGYKVLDSIFKFDIELKLDDVITLFLAMSVVTSSAGRIIENAIRWYAEQKKIAKGEK